MFSNWGGTERYNTARYYIYDENIDEAKVVSWAKVLNKDEAKNYCNEFMDSLKK